MKLQYNIKLRSDRIWLNVLLVIIILILATAYIFSNWGIRKSVRPIDLKVLQAILSDPLPASTKISHVYVEYYKRFLIPAHDIAPDNFLAIYEVEIDNRQMEELLAHEKYVEHPKNKALLYVAPIKRHFDTGDIERYLTFDCKSVSNHLFVCNHKGKRLLYIRTYGVDYPEFWKKILVKDEGKI